jgi:penicillin-binding protein 1A
MAMATRAGASMPPYDPAVHCASVALGAVEVSPLEMASAFGVFANHGLRAAPTPVLKVTDPAGEVLLDNTTAAERAEQVLPAVVADNVTDVMRGVLTDGTAGGKGLDRPAAGKTGTAQDNANSWFVGFTPTLSTSVWLGLRDCGAGPPCAVRNVGGVRGGITGGTVPATVWQRYMRRALASVPATEFTEPAPIEAVADESMRRARNGFDPGPRRSAAGTPAGGPYVDQLPAPEAEAPTTTSSTTTTRPPPPTVTTRPPFPFPPN